MAYNSHNLGLETRLINVTASQTSVSWNLLVPLRLLTHRLVRRQRAEKGMHCAVVVRNIRSIKRHARLLPPVCTRSQLINMHQ